MRCRLMAGFEVSTEEDRLGQSYNQIALFPEMPKKWPLKLGVFE